MHLRKCWKFHFQHVFSNVSGLCREHIMWLCVFHFRVRASCSRHGVCPCANMCWRREDSLWPNSFVLTNVQTTWCSCFLLVWMIIRHIPQSAFVSKRSLNRRGVHCGSQANRGISVGGGGRSYAGVHRNLVSKGVSCCDEVCS